MNPVLQQWNHAPVPEAEATLRTCCGAQRWAEELAAQRPIDSPESLLKLADEIWSRATEKDWLQAFAAHPRIGERKAAPTQSQQAASWSRQEQSGVDRAEDSLRQRLAQGNASYEERFGFTYIVCATGKSAEEMLALLEHRLHRTREEELKEAAEQQHQITQLRLRKWLNL